MRRIITIFICITLLSVCGYRIYRDHQQSDQLNAEISRLNAEIAQLQSIVNSQQQELNASQSDLAEYKDTYRDLFSQNYDLQLDYEETKRIYDYCEKNLVFVVRHKTEYHRPHCYFIQEATSPLTHYTVEEAEANGYTPCFLCIH